MIALGLILVLLALVVLAYVWFATRDLPPMEVDWGVFTAELTPLQLFAVGAATVLVLSVGTALLLAGLRKQGAKRAEVKRLRKEVQAKEAAQPAPGAVPADRATAPKDRPGTDTDRPVTGTDRPVTDTGTDRPVTHTATDRPVTHTDRNQDQVGDREVGTSEPTQPIEQDRRDR